MSGRAAQIPAWAPRLDTRSMRRRAHVKTCVLVTALALFAAPAVPWLAGSGGPDAAEPIAAAALLSVSTPAPLPPDEPVYEPAAVEVERVALPAEPAEVLVVPAVDVPSEPEPALDADPASATIKVITGHVPRGGTVSEAMQNQGVSPLVIHELAAAIRPLFDFRRAHAGDFFALVQDSTGRTLSFEFQRGRRDIFRLERESDGGLRASHAEVPLERRVVQLAGLVSNSLFEAVLDLGETGDLAAEFAQIFIWDFDFARETRPGDEFRMVVEKFYDREGFVRYGTILAAQYKTAERNLTAVYFEDDDGYGDYYTPDGASVRRAFLRAPLRYSRISSYYSNSRLHPILKVRRPHHGIDYAAPTGTPVWAIADGEVIFRGRSGGFGRLVKIRHQNGYVSYYGHLSRFADEFKIGTRVKQKDVIGYVGSSGLSSGPHLDFRLKRANQFLDPMKVKLPHGEPIPVRALERFEDTKRTRLSELANAAPALVLEAAM